MQTDLSEQTRFSLSKPRSNPERTEYLSYINCANYVHTGFVQVQLHLHRRLHFHVVLEEAAAERGLVVGLLRLGLECTIVQTIYNLNVR